MHSLLLRFARVSLRARLLALVALASVPTILATVWLSARERREAVERTQADLRRIVEDATVQHDATLAAARRLLVAYALLPDVATGSREACERTLNRAVSSTPELFNPTRTSAAGVIDCNPGRGVGADVNENLYFRRALTSDSAVIGPYRRSTTIPEPFVPLNYRITDESGRVAGVLSVGVRMQWLERLASRLELPRGSVVTLMSEDGIVLARYPENGLVGERFESETLSDVLAAGDSLQVVETQGLDGVRRWSAVVQLPSPAELRVAVGIGIPTAAVTDAADTALRLQLAVLIAALAVAALIAWFAATPLVLRDVQSLVDAADRIGTGDFTARAGASTTARELQRLARSMDKMAERLGEREERQLQAQKLESLGRLAGGIAHDFNNLLTAIIGHIDIAQEDLPPGSVGRESLEVAHEAARRSGGLTRQLLTFARRDSLQMTPLPLGPVLNDTAELLRHTLGTAIRIEVADAATNWASIDQGRIEQALVNLALNARDAMPDGGTLTLSTADVRDEEPVPGIGRRDWVRLDVRDSGTGMPADVRAKVFEPFFTTKAMGKGTGLGLAMVYGTMQQLGGTATVQSAVGRGTTFSLWFPAVAPSSVEPGKVVSAPFKGVGQGRVLLVEDEAGVRAFAARLLRRAGYQVLEAEDGAAALRTVQEEGLDTIDILLTDVVMPQLGGVRLAETLRARRPTLPVVLMSGYLAEEQPTELLQAPRTAMLEKPFEASVLLETLVSVRRRPESTPPAGQPATPPPSR